MVKKKICALTIAGSDSSAGAGIQSDLKTFQNFGLYGLTVVTAVTAQNTMGVQKSFVLPPAIISAQMKSVFSDFTISAAKTGMLGSAEAVKAVARNLKGRNIKLVVDPVMLSKNRFHLLNKEGIAIMKKYLLPLTYLITPNLDETEMLAGFKMKSRHDLNLAAEKILSYGCKYVLLKGGHFHKAIEIKRGNDVLYDGQKFTSIKSEFVRSNNTHGIGCTFSAAITASLAEGSSVQNAIIEAKLYIVKSLKKSIKIGKGVSPVEQ